MLFSCGSDNVIRVWELDDNRFVERQAIKAHSAWVNAWRFPGWHDPGFGWLGQLCPDLA